MQQKMRPPTGDRRSDNKSNKLHKTTGHGSKWGPDMDRPHRKAQEKAEAETRGTQKIKILSPKVSSQANSRGYIHFINKIWNSNLLQTQTYSTGFIKHHTEGINTTTK